MGQARWSRERIVADLIKLYDNECDLRSKPIGEADSGLHGAIYYRDANGVRKYFSSLGDAREAVARELEDQGRLGAALVVKNLNKPQVASNKFSDEKKESIRQEAVKTLRSKVERGENVGLRCQRATDRQFASVCERYFDKGYEGCFVAAGLDYGKLTAGSKRTKKDSLEELMGVVRGGEDLDKETMSQNHHRLLGRLGGHFSGYYSALSDAQKKLSSQGELEYAVRADPDQWKALARERGAAKKRTRDSEAQEKISVFDYSEDYCPEDVKVMDIEETISGRDLAALLLESDDWFSSAEMSEKSGTTVSNIIQRVPANNPEKTIRLVNGRTSRYLFHRSLAGEFEIKNKFAAGDISEKETLARMLGVGVGKIRNISETLGLGKLEGKSISFYPQEVEILSAVIERERRLHARILKIVSPKRRYDLAELSMMGVPISYFDRAMRAGKLATELVPSKKGPMARTVDGADILKYFEDQYSSEHLSQGLRLLSFFSPDLHIVTDLVEGLQITRSTVLNRLNTLLKENPDACFRIRKSDKRSRVLATSDVIPSLKNWEQRHHVQLLGAIGKFSENLPASIARKDLKDLTSLLGSSLRIPLSEQKAAFELLKRLSSYENQEVKIDGEEVAQGDLSRIYHYMASHGYPMLEMKKRYSLEELGGIVGDRELLEEVSNRKDKLKFALAFSNEGLVGRVLSDLKLDHDLYFEAGQDALMNAVGLFDVARKNKFSSYACVAIRRKVFRESDKHRDKLASSLQEPLPGSGTEKGFFIEDKNVKSPVESARESELEDAVGELLDSLTNRQAGVIMRRFGLMGYEKKTLRGVGKDMGVSGEWVRKIEKEALKSLSKNEKAKKLLEGI